MKIHKPRIETYKSTEKWLTKRDYQGDLLYFPSDTLYVDLLTRFGQKILATCILTDSSGSVYQINPNMDRTCIGKISDYYSEIGNPMIWTIDSTLQKFHFLDQLSDQNGKKFPMELNPDKKWILTIFYAEFLGRYSEQTLAYTKRVPENVQIFFVNMDLQENMSDELKTNLKFNFH